MRPVLFSAGPFVLHGYGAMIVLGGVLSFLWIRRRGAAAGLRSDDDFWLLVNAIIVGGFVGGRLLYLAEYTRPFSPDFWRTLFSPSRGFSVLGAFAGVPLATALLCRLRGIPFLRLFDAVCVAAPFWHAFGRAGCFLAGCCHGRPADVPWAVVFRDPESMVRREWLGVPLHPAQLYEAGADLLLAAGLYVVLRRTEDRPAGLVCAAYFGSYGVLRFILERWRGDAVPLPIGLTAGQAMGLGLVAASAATLAWRARCSRRS